MTTEKPPERDTPEFRWWRAGALAEAEARKEGRSEAGRKVLHFVDAVARNRQELDEAAIARTTFRSFALPYKPSLRDRLRLALWVLRGGKGRV